MEKLIFLANSTAVSAILSPKIRRWAHLAASFAMAQVIIKAIAMVSSLVLVNALPVTEYGLFTLLLANFTFLVGITDFGATGSLAYFWRRARSHAEIFNSYLHAVVKLRRTLFLGSILFAAAFAAGSNELASFSPVQVGSSVLLLVAATWFTMHGSTSIAVLRLKDRFRDSYVAEAIGEFTKLVFAVSILLTGMRFGWVAMAGVAAGAAATALLARQTKYPSVPLRLSEKRARVVLMGVKAQVLPTIPWTIFFALQGPAIAWATASLGSLSNLAEVGALGRLGTLIAVVSTFTITVFVPRLARVQEEAKFLRLYAWWWVVLLAIGGSLLLVLAIWPEALLGLLGAQYRRLTSELFLTASAAVLMTLEYYAGAVNKARGWVQGQFRRILIVALAQVSTLPFLDFSVTRDVLTFGVVTALGALLAQVLYNVQGLLRNKQH